ncbi:acyltransferase family protein [Maridesulfovibrio sp. FT414]|uniref:acyltransferase family protein n=1 Tax=Maridesulfovibrio sp. FT414 TaxID=2979469 RepID=UPI003D807C41
MASIKYRREIDGLRAVAVLLVVLSHAQFSSFEGGFIGVDVFFVISGYLISSILLTEIDSNKFSLTDFYIRRIRRILPALLFMLLCVTLVSLFVIFPQRLIDFAEAQLASITSWVNYFLWRFFGGYWRSYVKAFPLTHTWSLSVEEQFYFIWPILLFCAYKFIPKKYHPSAVMVGGAGLLCLSQYLIRFPEFAFYMIPARAYELFMGAGVAILFRKPVSLRLGARDWTTLFEITGLALILIPAILYKEKMVFPGVNALWPCLGTAMLVMPKRCESVVTVILSLKPVVGIGRISYSLYLWHWPPFAFIVYAGYSVPQYRWVLIAFSFIAAFFSYRFVEQPFRKSNRSLSFLFIVFVTAPAFVALIFFMAVKHYDGFPQRFAEPLRSMIVAVESSPDKFYPGAQLGKGSPITHDVNKYTTWGNSASGKINALLIGDSHSTAIRPFVEVLTNGLDIRGLQTARDSTPFLRNVTFFDRDVNKKLYERTDKRLMVDYWSKLIDDPHIQYVFIAAFYYSRIFRGGDYPQQMLYDGIRSGGNIVADNKVSFANGLRDSVRYIVEKGKIPVLFKDVPFIGEPLSLNFVKNEAFGTDYNTKLSAEVVYSQHGFEDSVIDGIQKDFPSTIVIDPKRIICPDGVNGECLAVVDGFPLYADHNHLNYLGAKYLAELWLKRYGNPLANRAE